MRLFGRLLIGNIAPVTIVTAALLFTLVALVRMTMLLQALGENELVTLKREGELHHACWSLDVAMRRAERACVVDTVSPEMRTGIVRAASNLRHTVQNSTASSGAMVRAAHEYLAVFERVQSGGLCNTLLDRDVQRQRSLLDESFTNSWETRLEVLYAGVAAKEERARLIGATAASAGVLAALGSLLLALVLARRMAQSVNVPLARLAHLTRQVGRGDFSATVQVHGPAEIEALAQELEQMRVQLAKLETLKQGFLASVSHELRTPLSKIREALALLSDGALGDLDARKARVVDIARMACEREIRLVGGLLDLSRLRMGSPLRFEDDASVDRVLESAVQDERADAQARGIEIVVEREGTVPSCRLDVVLLERAIANLVRNAVSVSQRGQTVCVVRSLQVGGDWIEIDVIDEGPGVPEEVRDNLFQAFVTSTVPGSPKALGVGLGLALAREVARAHGGALVLRQSPHPGAIFCLTLPVHSASADGPSEQMPHHGLELAN